MSNTNKKGFTIVELVIVIAVIAILAAVLIPTFSGIIRKANISSDTAVAKNLNVAAISAEADTFDEAIAAVREAGYYLAKLNAKADECYFAWDDENNQFVFVSLYGDVKTEVAEKDWVTLPNGKVLKGLGKINTAFIMDKYKANAMPYYIIVDANGKEVVEPRGYNLDKDAFVQFLENAVATYNK